MRKLTLLLALGLFLSASVSANACDKDKVSKTGKTHSCCMKGTKAKECMKEASKDCSKDPQCIKDMKAMKHKVKKDVTKG
jgi:hypothetical protein